MTGAICQPLPTPIGLSELEQEPDRFFELLECLADLRVVAADRRVTLTAQASAEDPRVRHAIEDLDELDAGLAAVAAKAAFVHQSLQHQHLI
jgi:hypothetical protein